MTSNERNRLLELELILAEELGVDPRDLFDEIDRRKKEGTLDQVRSFHIYALKFFGYYDQPIE